MGVISERVSRSRRLGILLRQGRRRSFHLRLKSANRKSSRKMAHRSVTSRGRLVKLRPKSPMMRMAEMRKNGLRGRALRQVGKRGSEGPEIKVNKGRKEFSGKGSRVLAPIPESVEVKDGGLEGSGVEGSTVEAPCAEVAAMVEDRNVRENLEIGLVGFSEQSDSRLEAPGGSAGGLEEGQSSMIHVDEVFDDMPQGSLIDWGVHRCSLKLVRLLWEMEKVLKLRCWP